MYILAAGLKRILTRASRCAVNRLAAGGLSDKIAYQLSALFSSMSRSFA